MTEKLVRSSIATGHSSQQICPLFTRRRVHHTPCLRRLYSHRNVCRSSTEPPVSTNGSTSFPDWMPRQIEMIEEAAALELARSMQRAQLHVPSLGLPVDTAYVEAGGGVGPPIVLLHGFDSSLLEFRRLLPLLAESSSVLAVDLIGWGFSCAGFRDLPELELGPQQKTDHLYQFWKSKVRRPMVLVGTSLGSAIAVHFARQHPEAVEKLVFAGPQVYVDGIGPMATMPRLLFYLGVQVLRSVPLRSLANKMAYFDKEHLATQDALRIGRLHTHMPGWTNANIAFMRSGGYSVSESIRDLQQDTLVMWGRHDGIVGCRFAERFAQDLPHSRLVLIEECGHCIHLEKPLEMARHILEFAAQPVTAYA